MALSGKYEIVKNEGHYEHLIASGLPEDLAKKSLELKTLEISINGDKVTVDRGDGRPPKPATLNQEAEETGPNGEKFKSKSTLNGDVLTIEWTNKDGTWKRVYSLAGSELTAVSTHSKPGVPAGKRIYKKL